MKAHIFVLLLVVVGLTCAENVKEEAEAFKSIRIGEDLKLECVPSEKDDKVKRDTKGETEGESQEGSGITPIKWIRKVNNNDKFEVLEDDDRITMDKKTLVITKVKKSDMGKYQCKEDDKQIKAWEVTDLTFRLTAMKPSYPIDIGADTTNLDFNCLIKGQANVAFLWFIRPEGEEDKKENKLICTNDDCTIANNSRISVQLADSATRSVLQFKKANITDRMIYTCRVVKLEDKTAAENVNFNCTKTLPCFETESLLRVKDPLAAVWPFVGIVIEVVILCIIIFVCEKRRGAKEAEEAMDEDEGYNGNNAATSNSNIRQRK